MIHALPTRDRPWRPAVGCVLLLCWARWVAAAPSPDLALANAWLAEGRYRQAAAAYQAALEVRPDDTEARLGLSRAWAAVHRCTDALELLRDLRAQGAWTVRAAAAEGDCRWAGGDLAGALVAYEEAVWLQPRSGYGWMRLEAARRAAGEVAGVEEARDVLLTLPAGPLIVATARAEAAVAEARPVSDARLLELARYRSVGSAVIARHALLDGRRWLDVGWPEQAVATLLEGVRHDLHGLEVATWHAEAMRRVGDPGQAEEALQRPVIALQEPTGLVHAVRARIAVDLGRLHDAEAELAGIAPDPEVLASRWYLARARGESLEAHASRWASVDPGAPRRSLEQLVPVGAP